MSLSPISSVSSLLPIGTVSAPSSTDTNAPGVAPRSDGGVLSQAAHLFVKLDALSVKDPEKFKEVTSNIAAKLNQAADKATGPASDALKAIATRFETASETGDPNALRPPHQDAVARHHFQENHHLAAAYAAHNTSSADQQTLEAALQTAATEVDQAAS